MQNKNKRCRMIYMCIFTLYFVCQPARRWVVKIGRKIVFTSGYIYQQHNENEKEKRTIQKAKYISSTKRLFAFNLLINLGILFRKTWKVDMNYEFSFGMTEWKKKKNNTEAKHAKSELLFTFVTAAKDDAKLSHTHCLLNMCNTCHFKV